jgi:hypothetical protein
MKAYREMIKQKPRRVSFLDVVLLPEPLDPPRGIDEFLFSRKKRMTCGAYFYMGYINCGSCLDFVPARTGDDHRLVFRMYTLFHTLLHTENCTQYNSSSFINYFSHIFLTLRFTQKSVKYLNIMNSTVSKYDSCFL